MGVEVTGLDAVLAALEDVAEDSVKKLTADFCLDVATAIAEEAKAIMPKDTGVMAALTVAEIGKGRNASSASVRVGRDAYYWRFLEYGDGPDGIEHAFFMRSREKVFADIDNVAANNFRQRLAQMMGS